MPVDSFRLENFMAFEDTGWIELRKINLLLGRNSSGKSAVIRALRLLKQSWLNEERAGQSLTLRIEGGVDLGSFENMRHRMPSQIASQAKLNEKTEQLEDEQRKVEDEKWKRNQVTFSYRGNLSPAEFEEIIEPIFFSRAKKSALPEDFEAWKNTAWSALQTLLKQFEAIPTEQPIFHLSAGYRQHKTTGQSYICKFDLGVCQNLDAEEFAPICGFEVLEERWDSFDIYEYIKTAPDYTVLVENVFKSGSYTHFLPELELPGELVDSIQRQTLELIEFFWQVCRKIITKWLESIVHVNPIRPLPQRSYALTEKFQHEWELGGWQAFLDYLKRPPNNELDEKVNGWFQTLHLGQAIQRKGFGFTENKYDVVKLILDEAGNGDERDLTDIGFGASQILPVIVQCLSAARDAFVLIEQPELHLHPEAQADIADLFIESVNELVPPRLELHHRQLGEAAKAAQEEEKKRPVTRRYLIETHSETIFMRLRVELARTTAGITENHSINPEDIVGHYVYRDVFFGASSIGHLLFDNKGEYSDSSGQFGDFFGQDSKEIDNLDEAVFKIKE